MCGRSVGSVSHYPGRVRPLLPAVVAALVAPVLPVLAAAPAGAANDQDPRTIDKRTVYTCSSEVLGTGDFETFGVLRQQQCLEDKAAFPVVMRLSHIPTRLADVDEIFDSANVIVTTMQIAGRAEAAVQERMAARASALFIDEAHHIGAPTWARFRGLFADREPPLPIVQFTATPFREDGRRVDGEFIVGPPKSDAGSRDVAIPPHLVPLVKDHLSRHTASGKDALLFPAAADSNAHMAPSTLYKVYYPARKAAGRPDLRWHDLRHTGAVLAAWSFSSSLSFWARAFASSILMCPRAAAFAFRAFCCRPRISWFSSSIVSSAHISSVSARSACLVICAVAIARGRDRGGRGRGGLR